MILWFYGVLISFIFDQLDELLGEVFRTATQDTPGSRICKRLRSTEGEIGGCPGESLSWWLRWDPRLHPGRLTWNLKMMVWKMIFLFNWVIFRFHVNLPGCIWTYSNVLVLSLVYALWVYACTGNQIVITQFSLLGTASQKSRSCLLAAYIMIFLSWEITIWDGTVGREVEQQEKLQKLEREHQETWIAESAAIWLWWRYGNCIIMVQL